MEILAKKETRITVAELRLQAVTGTGFHAVSGIGYVGVESKPGRIRIGIEECIKIKVFQKIR